MPAAKIDISLARKVLAVVDKGLSEGLDNDLDENDQPIPGKMCVEAAVCYAMGLDHDDCPPCVADAVRNTKICLNDRSEWASNKKRSKGLRRAAIAQLGSNKVIKNEAFTNALMDRLTQAYVIPLLVGKNYNWGNAESIMNEIDSNRNSDDGLDNSLISSLLPDDDKKAQKVLNELCEHVVQVLIQLKSPGAKWLT